MTRPTAERGGTPHCTGVGGRGCTCATHASRRVYAREWARRRRGRALDTKRMSATTCPRKFGRYGVCGGVLESDIIGGRLVVSCRHCERFARGMCRDCPRPVDGAPRKARFCAEHRQLASRTYYEHYRVRNHEDVLARARRSYRTNDEVRERRNAYKRAWRKTHRETVKRYKAEYAARHRETVLAYQVEYRHEHARKRRNRERARYRGTLPLRTCITPRCHIVLTGRKKKCAKCKACEAQQAAALLAARQSCGRRTERRRAA